MIRKHAVAKLSVQGAVLAPRRAYVLTDTQGQFDELLQSGATRGKAASPERWGYEPEPGMLYVAVRAISSRVNANYDGWPAEELEKGWRTFIGRGVFVEHHNWDTSRTRGVILDAKLHKDTLANGTKDYWVELLIEVDANAYPRLAKAIIRGDINTVSMGADVQYTVCSACGNKAHDVREYCAHIPHMKGRRVPTGKEGAKKEALVWEDCYGVNFFEISFVFDPADESAYVADFYTAAASAATAKAASRVRRRRESVGSFHQRVAYKEAELVPTMALPNQVDTLREEVTCPSCGQEFDGEICDNCGYEQPPEELDDPDTAPRGDAQVRLDETLDEFGETGGEPMSMDEYQGVQDVAEEFGEDAADAVAEELTEDEEGAPVGEEGAPSGPPSGPAAEQSEPGAEAPGAPTRAPSKEQIDVDEVERKVGPTVPTPPKNQQEFYRENEGKPYERWNPEPGAPRVPKPKTEREKERGERKKKRRRRRSESARLSSWWEGGDEPDEFEAQQMRGEDLWWDEYTTELRNYDIDALDVPDEIRDDVQGAHPVDAAEETAYRMNKQSDVDYDVQADSLYEQGYEEGYLDGQARDTNVVGSSRSRGPWERGYAKGYEDGLSDAANRKGNKMSNGRKEEGRVSKDEIRKAAQKRRADRERRERVRARIAERRQADAKEQLRQEPETQDVEEEVGSVEQRRKDADHTDQVNDGDQPSSFVQTKEPEGGPAPYKARRAKARAAARRRHAKRLAALKKAEAPEGVEAPEAVEAPAEAVEAPVETVEASEDMKTAETDEQVRQPDATDDPEDVGAATSDASNESQRNEPATEDVETVEYTPDADRKQQLEKNEVHDSGQPDSFVQKKAPEGGPAPYKASKEEEAKESSRKKAEVLRVFAFVEERERLGLSTRASRMKEISRFEDMDSEKFDGYVEATKEFKDALSKQASKRVAVRRSAPEATEFSGRVPELGQVTAAASSDDDSLDDSLAFI